VLWSLRDAAELAYWFGRRPVRMVVRQGRIAEGLCACRERSSELQLRAEAR